MCMAIGDTMIEAADVGIGIFGNEGCVLYKQNGEF